eukprot:7667964-Heterocapsa_arctica.AAC.1
MKWCNWYFKCRQHKLLLDDIQLRQAMSNLVLDENGRQKRRREAFLGVQAPVSSGGVTGDLFFD